MKESYGMLKKQILLLALCITVSGTISGCGRAGNSASYSSAASREAVSSQASWASREAPEASGHTTSPAANDTASQQDKKESGAIQDPDQIPMKTIDIFAMDTYMTLTAYGEECSEALADAEAEIHRLDALLSVGNEKSEVYQINNSGTGSISKDTGILLKESLELYQETGGAFDITIYPLMVEWGFTSGNYHVPEQSVIDKLLQNVDSSRITYDPAGETITLEEGQGIDFGAIAKGYTSSRVMDIFASHHLVSGLVSLGGNVQCYSTKVDGSLWKCGITNPKSPDDTSSLAGIIQAADQAVITSGGYERYFTDEKSGITYHHIIDPATGYSAKNGLASVTIVSPDGMLADGLSTSLFIMGKDKAIDFWRTHRDEFDMILITDDDQILITEGIQDTFTSNYEFEIIK